MEDREIYRIEVTEEDRDKRLDKFLARKMSDKFSRAFIQKNILCGNVSVDGRVEKNNYKISPGESVEMIMTAPAESDIMAEKIPLKIAYEDKDLLVVNKSPDMVVHPAPGNYSGTLVNALLAHCKNLSGIGGVAKPGIVHRLDKGTSGLIVVAKNDRAHRMLARQFKIKSAKRVYVALVQGVVEFDNGIVDAPIARDRKDRKKMVIDHESEHSKEAVTKYHVLERYKDSTLMQLTLGTGRTHQVRVHMAHIGHPVVGDEKYGAREHLPRPMLHAKIIGFTHPVTEKFMEFSCPIPRDMKKIIDRHKAAE